MDSPAILTKTVESAQQVKEAESHPQYSDCAEEQDIVTHGPIVTAGRSRHKRDGPVFELLKREASSGVDSRKAAWENPAPFP